MDIPRPPVDKRRQRLVRGGIAVVALVLTTLLLTSLKPAAPTVDSPWVDSVRQGTMVLEVHGPGTLVPEHIRWISALTPARVERIFVQPGTPVTASVVLLELSNPDVQIQALDAERQLSSAEAALVDLRMNLANQRLTQAGLVAQTRTQYLQAQRDVAVAETLAINGGLSRNDLTLARDKAAELETRYDIERQRLELLSAAVDSQLAVQRAQVARLRAITTFQVSRVNSLSVRAGESGVLQELPLQLGEWVVPGTILAKVVQPGKLKAVLRIPETQAPGLAVGQPASIDAHTGIVRGRVVRIDPAAQQGTVTVEIALDGALPSGARPDISVDGTITIDRLEHVLYVGRPGYGQPNSTIGMFKLVDGGAYAVRVPVKVGRSSVSTIEVVQGLRVGDRVILSDMSAYDNVQRVKVK